MSMAKVTITENAADFIIKYMAKAKKPKKKEYSRAEFLNSEAFRNSVKNLQGKGFSLKDIIEVVKNASMESEMSEVLKYNEKELRALFENIKQDAGNKDTTEKERAAETETE